MDKYISGEYVLELMALRCFIPTNTTSLKSEQIVKSKPKGKPQST